MGNDASKLKGLLIDKNSVETTDFWCLYNAEIPIEDGSTFLSIFQGEPIVPGQLWLAQKPLDRAIKNLMIYRHPYILKYITSWMQGSQKNLATERIRPLTLILPTVTDIEICLGLRNILCSLTFLIEQAKARHINITISSIYVNTENEWRLGGFEYVWKSKDLTKNLLDLAKSYRYKNAIDVNETKCSGDGLEQYAFAVLCEEIFKNRKQSDTPYVTEFRDYCSTHLKHSNTAMRPKLSAVLLHPYFNHEFILIHSFLIELPLKSPQEKQDFFTGLVDRLRYFDETVVGSQVGSLLLSRMVLLDTTAQLCVTPYVLKTKTDISSALFSNQTFIKYIIPRIKQILYVRDAQIRLILLEYFNEYVKLMSKEELEEQILPQLLLGIKDTNDILVAKTLRCLADLVPILGSEIVIGGNRNRIFADGRPQSLPDTTSHWIEPRSITPVMSSSGDYMASASPLPDNVDISESYVSNSGTNGNLENMPPRLSPDGGEDINNIATDGEAEEDAWSDWENDDLRLSNLNSDDSISLAENKTTQENNLSGKTKTQLFHSNSLKTSSTSSTTIPKIIDDINELDIKVQIIPTNNVDEFDFFKDMEPVIQPSIKNLEKTEENNIVDLNLNKANNHNGLKIFDDVQVDKSRFEFKSDEISNEAGWGDEDGWDDE